MKALAKLDGARRTLAECRTLSEVKRIRDLAEAARVYARAAHLGREAQNDAAEISLLAARKAGELLRHLERGKTGPKELPASVAGNSAYRKVLKETNTPERTARHWQKLADIPQKVFETYAETTKQSGAEITTAGLIQASNVLAPRKSPAARRYPNPVLNTVIQGDVFHIPIRDEVFQMVMTSPPYFGLRFYEGNSPDAFGREKTVVQYITRTVEALREIRRVLRNDGVVFWNIADSYLPNKSLCLVPERIAIAAQDDGWIVRDIIIWQKPNCIPESVQDRCTRSYESVLMLVKQKNYFWDTESAVEPSVCFKKGTWGSAEKSLQSHPMRLHVPVKKRGGKYGDLKLSPPIGNAKHQVLNISTQEGNRTVMQETRNLRNVWTVPTANHRESHIAMFPEALVERAILCGSREGDTVFDPFAGSGTTGLAAKFLNRGFVLMDISEEYTELMLNRDEVA